MKKAIAVFFLLVFLSMGSVFGQVLRVPILIHHYLEHVEWDNNPSFIDFLTTHYAKEINHPDDKHGDHGNLPFKSTDFAALQVVAVPPQVLSTIVRVPVSMTESTKAVYNQPDYSNSHLDRIWQPPRFS